METVLEIPFEKKSLYAMKQRNIHYLMNRHCFYKFFYIIQLCFHQGAPQHEQQSQLGLGYRQTPGGRS